MDINKGLTLYQWQTFLYREHFLFPSPSRKMYFSALRKLIPNIPVHRHPPHRVLTNSLSLSPLTSLFPSLFLSSFLLLTCCFYQSLSCPSPFSPALPLTVLKTQDNSPKIMLYMLLFKKTKKRNQPHWAHIPKSYARLYGRIRDPSAPVWNNVHLCFSNLNFMSHPGTLLKFRF